VRITSIQTFNEIANDGTLSKEQREVLVLFAEHKRLTGRQLDKIYGHNDGHKRVSELARSGHIVNVGMVKDKETGRLAGLWEYTGQQGLLPMLKGKRKSRAQLEAEVLALTAEVERSRALAGE